MIAPVESPVGGKTNMPVESGRRPPSPFSSSGRTPLRERTSRWRLDRFTVGQPRTEGGKVVSTARLVVSPDGRVLVVTDALPDGTPMAVLVYEKR